MASVYGKGIHPFNSPTPRGLPAESDNQLPLPEHRWGILKPHYFDFSYGTDVRRNDPVHREQIFKAVRVTGSGVLQNEGRADQAFQGGAILVERTHGGEVRVFSPEVFLRHFERSEGGAFQFADEVTFQSPEKRAKDVSITGRRAA